MEGLKSRAVALVVCIALILVGWFGGSAIQNMGGQLITTQASGLKANTVVMKIDDQSVTAGEYLYWLTSACDTVYQYYGITDLSMSFTADLTVGDYVREQADYYVSQYAAIRQLAAEKGITLTEGQQSQLDDMNETYASYYGGDDIYRYMLAYAGLNEKLLREISEVPYLYNNLCEQMLGEGGELEPTDENLKEYAERNSYTELSDEDLLARYKDTGYGAMYDYVDDYINAMNVEKTEQYDQIDVAAFYTALTQARAELPRPASLESGSAED